MKQFSLVIVSIGLGLIMLSPFGSSDMQINYTIMIPGVVIAAIGGLMFLLFRKNKS